LSWTRQGCRTLDIGKRSTPVYSEKRKVPGGAKGRTGLGNSTSLPHLSDVDLGTDLLLKIFGFQGMKGASQRKGKKERLLRSQGDNFKWKLLYVLPNFCAEGVDLERGGGGVGSRGKRGAGEGKIERRRT